MSIAKKVIGVIDDEMQHEALGRLIVSLGYQIELYASSEAFIDAVMSSENACLVIDINLGDISGIELARQLRAMGCKFPVIFMTGRQDAFFRKQAMEFGCVAYLQKPFQTNEIEAALTAAFEWTFKDVSWLQMFVSIFRR